MPANIDEIKKEQQRWDNELTLLREAVSCWQLVVGQVEADQLLEIEDGLKEMLRAFWSKTAVLLLDPDGKGAIAVHPDGRCLDLVSGTMSEWEPEEAQVL